MKRLEVLIIILFALVINCSAEKKNIQKSSNKIITIKGKVTIYGNIVYIDENWKTRSKISYKVVNKTAKDLLKHKDAIVEVKGIIIKQHSIWSKDIKVLKFKKVE